MLRSSRQLARIALERNWIDLPGKSVVRMRRNDAALSIQLDDDRSAFVFTPHHDPRPDDAATEGRTSAEEPTGHQGWCLLQ